MRRARIVCGAKGCVRVSDRPLAARTPDGSKILELEPIEAKRRQLLACVERAADELHTPPLRESPREGTVASSHRQRPSTPSDHLDDGIDFERLFQGADSTPALSRTASEASVRPCVADLIVGADTTRCDSAVCACLLPLS